MYNSRTNGSEAAYEKKWQQNPEHPRHVATRTVKGTRRLLPTDLASFPEEVGHLILELTNDSLLVILL